MTSALDDLTRWFREMPRPVSSVDCSSVESELGTALPSDYKEFVNRFGACWVQHLNVCAPGSSRRTISDGLYLLEAFFNLGLAEYRGAPGWPDHTKLLLWGDIDSDPVLCWDRSSSDDPDEWRTVVFDTVGQLVWLDGNMTTCVRDMITGRQRPNILGGDFAKPKLWVCADGEMLPIRLD